MKVSRAARLGALAALSAVSACASVSSRTAAGPEWFSEGKARADQSRYPKLGVVPAKAAPIKSDQAWADLASNLARDLERLQASDRSAAAPPTAREDALAFERAARAALGLPAPS